MTSGTGNGPAHQPGGTVPGDSHQPIGLVITVETRNPTLILAALAALLAVGFGAFGAHGLRDRLSEADLAIYRTAVDYHMWHALGLGLIGLLIDRYPASRRLRWAGRLMVTGILLFSGSLYLLSVTHLRWLGMITPVGGLSFLAAWAVTALALSRMESRRS